MEAVLRSNMLCRVGGDAVNPTIKSVLPSLIVAICVLASVVGAAERVEKGNLVIDGIPEIPERISERLNQYQNTRSARFEGWLPDGSGIIISTRFGETAQFHMVTAPGGARRQLTFSSSTTE